MVKYNKFNTFTFRIKIERIQLGKVKQLTTEKHGDKYKAKLKKQKCNDRVFIHSFFKTVNKACKKSLRNDIRSLVIWGKAGSVHSVLQNGGFVVSLGDQNHVVLKQIYVFFTVAGNISKQVQNLPSKTCVL